jgi:hypothetical protein
MRNSPAPRSAGTVRWTPQDKEKTRRAQSLLFILGGPLQSPFGARQPIPNLRPLARLSSKINQMTFGQAL